MSLLTVFCLLLPLVLSQNNFCFCTCGLSSGFCSVVDFDGTSPCDASANGLCVDRTSGYLGSNSFASLRGQEFFVRADLCNSSSTCCPRFRSRFIPQDGSTFPVSFQGTACNNGGGGSETVSFTANGAASATGTLQGGAVVSLTLTRPAAIDFGATNAEATALPACFRVTSTFVGASDCSGEPGSVQAFQTTSCGDTPSIGTCDVEGNGRVRSDSSVGLDRSRYIGNSSFAFFNSTSCATSPRGEKYFFERVGTSTCFSTFDGDTILSWRTYCLNGQVVRRAYVGSQCSGDSFDNTYSVSQCVPNLIRFGSSSSGGSITFSSFAVIASCDVDAPPPPTTAPTTAPASAATTRYTSTLILAACLMLIAW